MNNNKTRPFRIDRKVVKDKEDEATERASLLLEEIKDVTDIAIINAKEVPIRTSSTLQHMGSLTASPTNRYWRTSSTSVSAQRRIIFMTTGSQQARPLKLRMEHSPTLPTDSVAKQQFQNKAMKTMAISNIIGTIGTIMPLRAPSGLSSIAPAGSRENTAPPSTPVLVNLSGLPANTPENVKRLTNRIVQVQERLDYILKVYVIGMNNIAATQMYVALDILEPSPLYRHNLKRFVKEAIALHEKYQGKLRRGFQDKESEYFFSDFYTHMEKHFTPLTMKLRATAMNIANAFHQQNPVILASMVTAERLLSMADIYYDKAIEKTIEVSGLSLNYHERYDYLSFKRIHQNWLNAVRQLSNIRFEDSIDLVAVCNEIVSFISTNSASNKAAETAATLNRENFPELYQEIQDSKVQNVAGKLKDKFKVTKLK